MTNQQLIERNNITFGGSGNKTLFFVHGYGCDQNMWRFVVPTFAKEYKTIMIDLVGSGKSDTDAYDYVRYSSLAGYADDIIEICEAFALQNIIFIGHSVSSMIGALASIKKPTIFDKLIMVCPSPRYINDEGYIGGFSQEDISSLVDLLDSNYLGWTSMITPIIMGNPEKPELTEELANSFCRNNPNIARHFAKVTFGGDNREDMPKVSTQTLIIQSEADVIVPVEVGNYLRQHIPHSRLIVMPISGHCPHLSAPQETIEVINEFLLS